MTPLLSVYLDQVDNDPIEACRIVADIGITNICLKRAWSTFIGDLSNDTHDRLMSAISANKLQVIAIDSNLGNQITQPADELNKVNELLKICQAYNCQQLLVRWGRRARKINAQTIMAWVEAVSINTLIWAVQPIYPITSESAVDDPAVLSEFLHNSKRWKVSYDPAALVAGNSDHLTKYWPLLQNKVWGVEFKDAIPGTGQCAIGTGRAKLDVLLSEWARADTKFWLILKTNVRPNTTIRPQFIEYLSQLHSLAARIGVLDRLQISWPDGI